MFDDCSHRIELTIGVVTGFFAFVTKDYMVHWIIFSILSFLFLIIDFMFFQEGTFIYDPDYTHWKDLNQIYEMKEFQIHSEDESSSYKIK